MLTIGVAELKAHLSRELRRAAGGETIIVTDHSREIAVLGPLRTGMSIPRPAAGALDLPDVPPLIASDAMEHLMAERGDR
mgnify:CR=1 FL=1